MKLKFATLQICFCTVAFVLPNSVSSRKPCSVYTTTHLVLPVLPTGHNEGAHSTPVSAEHETIVSLPLRELGGGLEGLHHQRPPTGVQHLVSVR